MADYFDHFSFALPLHAVAEADWWNQVLGRLENQSGATLPANAEIDRLLERIPELEYASNQGSWWGIDHSVTPPGGDACPQVWFRATYGTPNVVALAVLTSAFLRKFRRAEGYGIECAMTCSKPRLDGFGGTAVWVTARGCRWLSTHDWLERCANRHERQQRRRLGRGHARRADSPASGPDVPEPRKKRGERS